MGLNRNMPPVNSGNFAMVPRGDVPRSTFQTRHGHKTTFDGNELVPIYVDEVLPGDHFRGSVTMFVRMATPLFPVMDDIEVETFFFFVPNRIVWNNWVKLMGEQDAPGDVTAYLTPHLLCNPGGWEVGQLGDYFGLPVKGQMLPAATKKFNALPFRAYNLIWNEWFRPQDFSDLRPTHKDSDGPDPVNDYSLMRRYKKHDYFTSALPWPTKNNVLPSILLGGNAPIKGLGINTSAALGAHNNAFDTTGAAVSFGVDSQAGTLYVEAGYEGGDINKARPAVFADLSEATGASINSLRLAVATQQLLERDARGGTRYTEILRSHFGVTPSDARLQRPEYIGGGRTQLNTQAIPQTSATGAEGTPLGSLGAATTGSDRHEFSCHAEEHGFIVGLVNVTGTITYQQGVHRMWTRETRYEYFWPAYAFLGEQAIRADEIFCKGDASDVQAWGFQERWSEYRYRQSKITGLFRSNVSGSLDSWHLAQHWTDRPGLTAEFLQQDTPFGRVLAAGDLGANQQFLFDSVFNITCTRALPVRSVPGLVRF